MILFVSEGLFSFSLPVSLCILKSEMLTFTTFISRSPPYTSPSRYPLPLPMGVGLQSSDPAVTCGGVDASLKTNIYLYLHTFSIQSQEKYINVSIYVLYLTKGISISLYVYLFLYYLGGVKCILINLIVYVVKKFPLIL